MDSFHLAEREPVALAIEAAARCTNLGQLYAAIESYEGYDVARTEGYTPCWPISSPVQHPDGPLMIVSEKPEPGERGNLRAFEGKEYGWAMREALERCGVDVDQIHVAFACHWNPGDEKSLNATQISASRPFLVKEIELVRPRAILAPGRGVLEALLMYRGKVNDVVGMTMNWKRGDLTIPVYTTWHPAFAARFKTQMPEYHEQVRGFFERFGMPDGSPVRDWRRRAA